MTLLSELQRQRQVQCRLSPEHALGSLEEAGAFLQDRGMLTRMPDCALPSLFGACHEEAANPAGRGFDLWPRTKWIWSFQLTRHSRGLLTKLHRGKSLYLSMEAARAFDPLVRQSIQSAQDDDATLLDHLRRHGPSMSEDVQLELGWDAKGLKRVRNRLERLGAVVSDGLVFESSSSWFFAPMRRWDQVVEQPPATAPDPYGDVILAGVRAAVVAPEREIAAWFSWPVPPGAVERLIRSGRLTRPRPGLVAERERFELSMGQ
ncbi:MAG TPA: hypothetical protein VGR23_00140 [Candidatus Dormibacteraeota bacterium]|nr:hypothetical protein [Candidatus Dormibacteraeota bacterium]